jgi:hypothetical protein
VKKVPDENADPSGKIVQEHFWPLISGFLRKGVSTYFLSRSTVTSRSDSHSKS